MFRFILAAAAALTLMAPTMTSAQNTPPQGGKAPPAAELRTTTQQASYAIGMNFGSQVKDASLDADALVRGIRDALSGAKSALSEEQIQAAMTAFSKEIQSKAVAEAGKNAKAGEEYLAANAKKPGVKTTESGLQYKVLKAGDGASPKRDSTVRVHYHGTFPDGSVFDSSVERKEPAEFPVNRVIAGWTEALQLMKVGDKWQLTIPGKLAYGEQGRPGIPPNQVLIFDVELLDIVE